MLQFILTFSDESNHGKIEHIYNTYYTYMMRYAISRFRALGRTNYKYDAEDAVQNAFMKIAKHIDKIEFIRGERDIKNYCFSILSNEICNVLGDKQEFFEINEEYCSRLEYNFIEELSVKESYNKVVEAIEELDEKYSTTLYLVFCEEMTVKEIAKMMGISAKTVYTRIARGKKLLIDSIKGARSNG